MAAAFERHAIPSVHLDTWQRQQEQQLVHHVEGDFDSDAVCPIGPSAWRSRSTPAQRPDTVSEEALTRRLPHAMSAGPANGSSHLPHKDLPQSHLRSAPRPKARDVPLSQQLWQHQHQRAADGTKDCHVAADDKLASRFCGSPDTILLPDGFGSGNWSECSSSPSTSPRQLAHAACSTSSLNPHHKSSGPASEEASIADDATFWDVHAPCLNFEEAEAECRALNGKQRVVEGVTILALTSRFGHDDDVAAGVLFALHITGEPEPMVPGDRSIQLLLPKGLRNQAQPQQGKADNAGDKRPKGIPMFPQYC